MRVVDLHTHSRFSDGTSSCSELLARASKRGTELFSLTDHDTVDGCAEAGEEARKLGVPFISGVEITTGERDNLHVLGLAINPQSKRLSEFLGWQRRERERRIEKTVGLLRGLGVDITFEEVRAKAVKSLSRGHVADILKEKNLAQSRRDAFRKYFEPNRPAYVPPAGAGVVEAIIVIKEAGGAPVLAHPGAVSSHLNLPAWTCAGLEGLEVFYPSHGAARAAEFLSLAKKYRLLATAGSDFHGQETGRGKTLGIEVPDEIFIALKKRLLGESAASWRNLCSH